MMQRICTALRSHHNVVGAGLLVALLSFPASSAEWISADGSGPSTPDVNLVSSSSSATILEVAVHGFYVEEATEAGVLYQQLSFGDNAALREVGKPELPIITRLVGIPDRSALKVSVQIFDALTLPGYHVWPAQEPTKDGEAAPAFVIDAGFYSKNVTYPEAAATVDQPQIWRDVRLTRLEVRPLSYNPGTGELTVATKIRVTVDYFGTNPISEFTRIRMPIKPEFQTLYRAAVINFDQLGYPLMDKGGTDDPGITYLVVTTTPCIPVIQPLVDFRNAQGYETEIRTIAPDFDTPEEIKAYITQLYNAYGLEYVLMVGDAYYGGGSAGVDVPMYYWVDSYSDSWYTMMDGPDDYLADLAIGRIVYDTGSELQHQIDKTMAYLTAPEVSNWAEHTLLVAHQEQYPLKYTQCKEEIRTYPYGIQVPIFGTAYGGAGATNQDVINYLNNYSSGILNYRGHGSDTEWWQWGPSGSFTATQVNQLTNYDRYFIHFDVCCDNMNIVNYNGNCLAESFMKAPAAAIAVNSAIIPSYTIPNHDYDKEFYKAIYDLGINHIGYASNYANITVYQVHGALGESNIRTYLWLGDACTDAWTNTMQTMMVIHDPVMLLGTNTLTVSTGFEGALVCAQNDEVYVTGYTNAAGTVTLTFNPAPLLPADLTLTVSEHNYLTYQATIPIIPPSGPYVVYNSCDINDAVVGNNNGQWDFGETVDLSIEVKNVGIDPATNVNVAISTTEPLVTIVDGQEFYGTINAGDSLSVPDGFRIQADPTIEDQYVILFTLTATSGSETWESYFALTVNAPIVTAGGLRILDPGGNNNGQLDPGETTEFQLTMNNDGHTAAGNVQVIMSVDDPGVTVTGNPGAYGTINPGGSTTQSYTVVADAGMQSGTVVTFSLDITADGGYVSSEQFNIVVGDVRNMPTGPDNYGYYAWDDNDGGESQPYNWIEIAPAAGGPGLANGPTSDDSMVQMNLPFSFRYYGQNFTQISVCSNGFLCMGYQTETSYTNAGIPSSTGPGNMIAAFWDDLHPGYGGTQICSYNNTGDHTFIVEWYNIAHYGASGTRETFEVILYDPSYYATSSGDGIILVQYSLVTDASSATFGIENASENDGIQYGYNNSYDLHAWFVEAERTITYTTNISGTPEVTLTLTPYGTPIIIPASGGSFDYNIAAANVGTTTASGQIWCDVILPNGSVYGPVLGPVAVTMPVGFSGDRDRTQSVPGVAPAGTYTYNGYIGAYPSVIWAQDSFQFEKSTTGGSVMITEWINDGESFDDWMPAMDRAVVPDVYSLDQNYPNPFNPLTTISFGLPEDAFVRLAVYDLLGRQVALLVNGQRKAGLHEASFNAANLASGLYVYRIEAGDFSAVRKMVLMK